MREMKDSGITFIRMIPKHWHAIPLKYIVKYNQNTLSETCDATYEFDYVDIGSVTNSDGIKEYQHYKFNNAPSRARRVVNENDIILSTVRTYLKAIAIIPIHERPIVVSTGFLVLTARNDVIIPKFLFYAVSLEAFVSNVVAHSVGINYPAINSTEAVKLKVLVPPLTEQQAIADFLDSKCTDIDSLIDDIQKQIETLKEYKKSVITQAVTKGLDPNVEMKDSGVEWIGQIPKKWIYSKITYVLDTKHEYPIGDGDHGTVKSNDYVQEGIPFIRVQNLGFATPLKLDEVVCITKKKNTTIKNSTLKPNDVLFAKTGSIGKVGIVPKELPISNTTSHVGKITVNVKIIMPRFLFYALSSTVGYKMLWDIAGQKSTRPELSIEEIKRLRIIFPKTIKEQQEIVNFLDSKCADIDAAIEGKQKQMYVLKEYKKSLIYEYVTGKKEMPRHE